MADTPPTDGTFFCNLAYAPCGPLANVQNFNSYSSWAVGYWTKTNTIIGYTEEQTFNYTTSFYANLFNLTYDNLNDYNIIQIRGAAAFPNHAAIAKLNGRRMRSIVEPCSDGSTTHW